MLVQSRLNRIRVPLSWFTILFGVSVTGSRARAPFLKRKSWRVGVCRQQCRHSFRARRRYTLRIECVTASNLGLTCRTSAPMQ